MKKIVIALSVFFVLGCATTSNKNGRKQITNFEGTWETIIDIEKYFNPIEPRKISYNVIVKYLFEGNNYIRTITTHFENGEDLEYYLSLNYSEGEDKKGTFTYTANTITFTPVFRRYGDTEEWETIKVDNIYVFSNEPETIHYSLTDNELILIYELLHGDIVEYTYTRQ